MPETASEMAAPARIEPQRAPGSVYELNKSADGSEVNGYRLKEYRSSVATSTLDKSDFLMEASMMPPYVAYHGNGYGRAVSPFARTF